jgi:hypothetical protein
MKRIAIFIIFSLAGGVAAIGQEPMVYPVPPVGGPEAQSPDVMPEFYTPTLAGKEVSDPDRQLAFYSKIGRGHYVPLKLKGFQDKRVQKFETSFEECAPGRNCAANVWTAFGSPGGNKDINCMGRDLRVRYPLFNLEFQMYQNGTEIKPDSLDSFRLGLVNNRLPAVWGSWQHEGLSYKVSVMTVPGEQYGNFDLYKLEIQNTTDKPAESILVAGVDGPPDMRLEDGVVHGQGDTAFVIADQPTGTELILRDYGLCDKRAKSDGYDFRLGLDGVPVVYRFKAQPGKKYLVYLTSPLNFYPGYYPKVPQNIGDQIFEYQVEGCPTQTVDPIQYRQDNKKLEQPDRPIIVRFDGAQDQNGDGYIEVRSGVTADSKCRFTVLGKIYVFPEEAKIDSDQSVYSGTMDSQCVWRIQVGVAPDEVQKSNEGYYNSGKFDPTDVGLARLKLNYTASVSPGEIKTYWLKIPPIHRRESAPGHSLAHTFRDMLPNEAIPPFEKDKVEALKKLDPRSAEQLTVKLWNAFFTKAARFELPDPVLKDIFLSRLATREIMDVKINKDVWYNACSPFGYFDHAYRDCCYSVMSRDIAGLHQESERLLRVYCMDIKDVKDKGPISFGYEPLQLGMLETGLWNTRPGQWDTQGQNIWALVQHYKLTGNRDWLEKTAWPFIRRGAMWIVNSRHKHMKEIGDPANPRYGLIEPGAMEVPGFKNGVHLYYVDAFAVLGLEQAAEAAAALDINDDAKMFREEYIDFKNCLHRSFKTTFQRKGLYEGFIWYGAETAAEAEALGGGMFTDLGYPLVWPCRAIDPQDPMWIATHRHMDYSIQSSGGGIYGGWPSIGMDQAMSYLLRGEPDKTLDYFCSYTDSANSVFCWGEGGYDRMVACGDQPYNWADANWIILFRNLFVFEDGDNLLLTPALFRRWHQGDKTIVAEGLPTYFGVLDLKIKPNDGGSEIQYTVKVTPKGDQSKRPLSKIILFPRSAMGRAIESAKLNGKEIDSFSRNQVILPRPDRNRTMEIQVRITDN